MKQRYAIPTGSVSAVVVNTVTMTIQLTASIGSSRAHFGLIQYTVQGVGM